METMESKRRKRKEDLPRITFNTPNRVFERLFKENSLESLRATVNKKLGIDPGMRLEFSQIRNERSIDLEDEDDFEAFKAYAESTGVAEVKVCIPDTNAPCDSSREPRALGDEPGRVDHFLQSQAPTSLANRLMMPIRIVNPLPQINGVSQPLPTPSVLANVTEEPQAKEKPKRKKKQPAQTKLVPNVAGSEESSPFGPAEITLSKETTKPKKNKSGSQVAGSEAAFSVAQNRSEHQANLATGNSGTTETVAAPEREATMATKPTNEKKGKGTTKRQSKKNGPSPEAADPEANAGSSSNAPLPPSDVPPGPSVTSTNGGLESSTRATKTKKSDSKKSKATTSAAPLNGELPAQDVSHPKSSGASLPNGGRVRNVQVENTPVNFQAETEAPSVKPKRKKRKLEVEDKNGADEATSRSGKAKKSKTATDTPEVQSDVINSPQRRTQGKPELEISLPPSSQSRRTRSSQAAKHGTPPVEPTTTKADQGNSNAPETGESEASRKDEVHHGVSSPEDGNAGEMQSATESRSGSTTAVDRSENGDANLGRADPSVPPYSQSDKEGGSSEPRAPSPAPSSSTENSDADNDDALASIKEIGEDMPRPSLSSIPSLQAIANRWDLFPPASTPRSSFTLSPAKPFGLQVVGDKTTVIEDSGHDSDSSSSSSSSDSGNEYDTNIPPERRAGSAVSKARRGIESVLSIFNSTP